MSSRVPAFLSLIRPLNLLIAFLSIVVAAVLAGGDEGDVVPIVLAAFAGIAVAAGANAINDRFDVEIDRVNRPDRPIPRGELTTDDAFRVWFACSLLAGTFGALVGLLPFAIVMGAVVVLYFYSRDLKATPLIGNLVVGGMTGMAFIYGAAAVGPVERGLIPALFAFLVNVARELVKDIEDREGDALSAAATLPVRYGVRPARILTSASLLILIAVTMVVASHEMYRDPFLPIVLVADALMAFVAVAVWWRDTPEHMRSLSGVLKLAMIVGLGAIWLGRPTP
ncbi:MAG: geranylgeranylglycerol-phosphate geranylgeranyltransferase [Bacteroidetes bacterium]|jgi:geranylgeranylglycerol-phosphate geranylgeranyltransferase|nr:geranylgeranylglycerol-phosphate geranylgeranyltransferase [Bacteroidota bacterium]